MSRYKEHRVPYNEQDRLWSEFCTVLARLNTSENIRRFLKDLYNRQERMMFIRRLQVAKLLHQGKTYEKIMKELHVGSDTIARVHRWLQFGRDGYKKAIEQLLDVERKK